MDFLYLVLSVGFVLLGSYIYMTNNYKKPKVLVIEGIIGAGKTTLINVLAEILKDKYKKIVVIPESVEFWKKSGALKRFYDDIKNQSYEFQTFVFVTRITNLRKVYKEHPDADLYIIERSPFTDRKIFAEMLRKSNMLDDHQMMKYELWWSLWQTIWPFEPSHFCHLCPGVKISQERVKERDREGEDKIEDSYQEDLLTQHLTFFKDDFKYPLLTLTENGDFRNNKQIQEKLKRDILDLLNK